MLHLAVAVLLVASPEASTKLPLTRLVLYENGLGYFERQGPVAEGKVAEIPLEPGQLDDALKSLVVVSPRGVASVEFSPALSADAARAFAGMPEPGEQGSMTNLLRSLRGVDANVTLHTGATLRGRLVDVAEETELNKDGKEVPAPALLLFGDQGLARVPVLQVRTVRPTDPQVQHAWNRGLETQATRPDPQRLIVRGSKGGGEVGVGYSTEAPVWRTTYRLVLGTGAPRLQGYALVHNDSDESWDNVKVTLASGHPTSFLMPLAGPRYGRRELVEPADGLETEPQLVTEEARTHLRGSPGEFSAFGGLGLRGTGQGGSGSGSGMGRVGSVTVRGATVGASSLLEDGPTPLEPAAVSEAGELFLYTVKEPVKLGARKSALLPIVDSRTAVEEVSVLSTDGTPMVGLRLTNTTGLTLEAGTLSVFTKGVYSGETTVDRVKPSEVRVVRHQEDVDLLATHLTTPQAGPVRVVRVANGLIELHRVDTLTHQLELTSRSARARTMLVELTNPLFRVTKGAVEDVRSPGLPRYARVEVKPKQDSKTVIVEEGSVVERVPPEALSTTRLDALLAATSAPEVKGKLTAMRAEAARAEAATTQREQNEKQLRELEEEATRLRTNLTAAGQARAQDAAAQLGAKLLKAEEAITKVKAEQTQLAKATLAARAAMLAVK